MFSVIFIFFFFYLNSHKKVNRVFSDIPEGTLFGGGPGGGNKCPTGKKDYDTTSGYPVLLVSSDPTIFEQTMEAIYHQIDNTNLFNRYPNRSAKNENISLHQMGYIKSIRIQYSSVGEIESTEAELRPLLEEFINLNSKSLGHPDPNQFEFVEDDNNKVYSFRLPNQKIGAYPVRDSEIAVVFVDGGITDVTGHWWTIEENVFDSLDLLTEDKLLENFTYTSIYKYDGTVPPANKITTSLDKNKFTIGDLFIIESDLCSQDNYHNGLFLVYEVKTYSPEDCNSLLSPCWVVYIDAATGEVISVK